MTSLDPSHFPDLGRKDHISRGNAVVRPQGGPNSAHLHIPVIPDLRFEYSYLKSIAPYVKTRRIAAPGADEKHSTEEIDIDVEENGGAEVVAIDWRKVAWITTRDQVISPLIQGAVWCVNVSYLTTCSLTSCRFNRGIASQFISPILSFMGSIFRPRRLSRPSSSPLLVKKESEFTQRFRSWSKSLTSGLETNIALAK